MVNINIQKKDLWLLSAIMVFLVGVGVVISYNPSGTGGTPSIMGHSADEIEGLGGGYAGQESYTFPGGLIIKSGYKSGNGDVTLTFDTAFPNAIVSFVPGLKGSVTDTWNMWIRSYSTSGATLTLPTWADGFTWIAVGY